jgi:hypothetical protein
LADTGTLRSTSANPGLSTVLSARLLAEFGDDPDRFTDAESRKNYAGTSRSPKPPASAESSSPATPQSAAR